MYFKLTAENIPFLTKTHLTYRRIYVSVHVKKGIQFYFGTKHYFIIMLSDT